MQHQLGYFSSRTVVSDARLQLGKNELAIPEFTVTLQFDGAEVHAPEISGNLVRPEGLALKIGDARVQLPMDSLRPEAPLRKGSLTMRQVDLISAEGSFSLEGVAINATQAQHAVWDTLTVLVAKLGFDAPNVAVVAQSVRMQQNHDPLVENRLGVGRSILFLDLDLTGKPLGGPNDQRAGHHVQALFETDSDGFLSGVSHRLL